MMTRDLKKGTLAMSRRTVLAGASATRIAHATGFSLVPHQFDRWVAEAYMLMDQVWSLPEDPEGPYDTLLKRLDDLDRLIIATPSIDEPAIRAKFGYLRWMMTNNGNDEELVAMDHLGEFIRRHCAGPWNIYTPR